MTMMNHNRKAFQIPQYFVWIDFETTGFSPKKNRAIQWAAEISDAHPDLHEISHWSTLIRPLPYAYIYPKITNLTGISSSHLYGRESQAIPFGQAYDQFRQWINHHIPENTPFAFVAHNGHQFDYAILWWELSRLLKNTNSDTPGQKLIRDFPSLTYFLDTLPMARRLICTPNGKYSLQHLYEWLFRTSIPNAHDARGDVTAMRTIMAQLNMMNNDLFMCDCPSMTTTHTSESCQLLQSSTTSTLLQKYQTKYADDSYEKKDHITTRKNPKKVSSESAQPGNKAPERVQVQSVTQSTRKTDTTVVGTSFGNTRITTWICEECGRILAHYFFPGCYACKKNTGTCDHNAPKEKLQ
jgi:DNA polymerase III epsilon subunit-like protein